MKKNSYDVVIIGGGIGGLVCGCYLSKSGLSVAVVEKNEQVGGYVTSFEKNKFKFNTYIRGFVGCRPKGIMNRILKELSLVERIEIIRPEVYDSLYHEGIWVHLFNDPRRTKAELIRCFPAEEKAIDKFFKLVVGKENIYEIYRYRNSSFQDLIDQFFIDKKLKFFLAALRIDSGENPAKTSAIADMFLIKGNILDGGYLPRGGMQKMPDLFAEFIRGHGGQIYTNRLVSKINLKNGLAKGVTLQDGTILNAKIVVSNSDATFTYRNLLGDANLPPALIQKIDSLVPATSVLTVYLGLATTLRHNLQYNCAAIWAFFKSLGDGIVVLMSSVADESMAPKGCESITIYYGMPYKNEDYWIRNKERIANLLLERFWRIFPSARSSYLFHSVATPIDLERMTLNREGSSRGWAPLVEQVNTNFPEYKTPVANVFMVGHWINSPYGNGGLTFAANTGRQLALRLIRTFKEDVK